jgi:hypothetical protein
MKIYYLAAKSGKLCAQKMIHGTTDVRRWTQINSDKTIHHAVMDAHIRATISVSRRI